MTSSLLKQTPLHALHAELGARLVPFAGFAMPVQYPTGILAEHRQCRAAAALFDVSHMGQIRLVGDKADAALESLVPVDVVGLKAGRQRYGFFTNDQGGLLDDLMIARLPSSKGAAGAAGDLMLVVNAACKSQDIDHLKSHLGARCDVIPLPDRALLALQGPLAGAVLARLDPAADAMRFMDFAKLTLAGIRCFASRSGYAGEDGFEISVPADAAEILARALLADADVKPAGLGARDSLRLEAGLCLYGHDIDATTTPIEAALEWAIQKVRRPGGTRAGGYPGSPVIEAQLAQGAERRRVGLAGLERAPVREGAALYEAGSDEPLGRVTSGTLAPSVDAAIAMAYLPTEWATPGTEVQADVRGRRLAMQVRGMPFAPHRYRR